MTESEESIELSATQETTSEGSISPSDDSDVAAENREEQESIEATSETQEASKSVKKKKRRRRVSKSSERSLAGRKMLCLGVAQIAPKMLKTVKLRVLGRYLDSTR